jgi:hypothetical protein
MTRRKKQPAGSSESRAIPLWRLHYFRRHAVWSVPIVALLHAMLTYSIWKPVGIVSLWVAALVIPGALAMRWFVERTTTLFAILTTVGATVVYVLGVSTPIAFLYVSHREDWVPYLAPLYIAVEVGWFSWRLAVACREDWAWLPADLDPLKAPARPDRAKWGASWAWLLCLVPFFLVANFARQHYMIFVMLIATPMLGLLMAEGLARSVAQYRAFRRFERSTGQVHRFPPEPTVKSK